MDNKTMEKYIENNLRLRYDNNELGLEYEQLRKRNIKKTSEIDQLKMNEEDLKSEVELLKDGMNELVGSEKNLQVALRRVTVGRNGLRPQPRSPSPIFTTREE